MAITILPSPPSRNDPATFADKGDAFLAALPAFAIEANALEINVNAKEISAVASAMSATASAAEASNTRVASMWSATTPYTIGVVAWSPIDQKVYRRKVAGTTATDPSADGANWSVIESTMPVVTVTAATYTMVAGTHYLVTTGFLTTVMLPASPLSGDSVMVTFANSLIPNVIARNGKTIMGLAENVDVDSANVTAQFKYMNNDWKIL